MNWQKFIGSDPNICHGQVCFKVNGKLTRIMVYLVLELLEADVSVEEILRDYYPQLSREHIKAALEFSSYLLKSEEYILSSTS
jgi:uncharacterized protein (DUF433 family)